MKRILLSLMGLILLFSLTATEPTLTTPAPKDKKTPREPKALEAPEVSKAVLDRTDNQMKVYTEELDLTPEQVTVIREIILERNRIIQQHKNVGNDDFEKNRIARSKISTANRKADERIIKHLNEEQVVKFKHLQKRTLENRKKPMKSQKKPSKF